MSEGLSIEGDKIFYDGQQVGVITIPEGTSLHADVTWQINNAYQNGFDDGYVEATEDN